MFQSNFIEKVGTDFQNSCGQLPVSAPTHKELRSHHSILTTRRKLNRPKKSMAFVRYTRELKSQSKSPLEKLERQANRITVEISVPGMESA